METAELRGDGDSNAAGGQDPVVDDIGRLAAELHEVVGTVRSRVELAGLAMPELDRLCAPSGVDRATAIERGIEAIQDPDYRKFFEVLLPLPFDSGHRWPPLGRKYISEADAGRGVLAGFEAFGVTTWDGLNAPLRELGGSSRRIVAERMLADAVAATARRPGSHRRAALVGAAVIAVLVAVVTAIVLVIADSDTADGDTAGGTGSSGNSEASGDPAPENPSARVAAETTVADPRDGTTTTVSLPESGLAGIQPGVERIPGDDLSGQLISALAEENLIFFRVPEGDVVGLSYYGRAIPSLPASFRYQAFNGIAPDLPSCRGMMSRELELTGLWERKITWGGGQVLVAVGRMATPEMAHELATAISVAAGADPSECRGLGYFNIEDYEDYGVTHRDDPTLLTDVDFNHWSVEDVVLPEGTWDMGHRIVVEDGTHVIDVVLASDNPGIAGDGSAAADVAGQILSRLEG